MEKIKVSAVILAAFFIVSCGDSKEASGEIRAVSIAPSVTELMIYLELEDRLVGVSRFCPLTNLPVVSDLVSVDTEAVLSAGANLVIASYSGNYPEEIESLEALGLFSLILEEHALSDIISNVSILAKTFGVDAEEKIFELSQKLNEASFNAAARADTPSAMVWISFAPIFSVTETTFGGDILKIAGFSNVVVSSVQYPQLSAEEVLALDADVLILMSSMSNTEAEISAYLSRLGKAPEIFYVDDNAFSRPSTGAIDLALELSETEF